MFRRIDGHRENSWSLFTTVTRRRKIFVATVLALAVAVMATIMILPRLLDLDNYRSRVLFLVQDALNGRRVSYESSTFSWQSGPAFSFRKLVIKDTNGTTPLLETDRLTFSLALLPLLRKEMRMKGVELERPVLRLDRNAIGTVNVADLFTGKPGRFEVHLHALRVNNGRVSFTDSFGKGEATTVELANLNLSLRNPNRGEKAAIKLSSALVTNGSRALLNISGTAAIPAAGTPLSATAIDLAIRANNLDMHHYWPFYGRYLPVSRLSGELELDGKCRGTIREFTSKGRLHCKRLQLDSPTAFPAPLTSGKVTLSYQMELSPQTLTARTIDLSVDGVRIKGSCSVSDIRSADPRISALLSTSPFRFAEITRYIPYGLIPAATAGFIRRHVSAGVFRLDEVRLDGRLSNLRHMGQGGNYKALFIRGRVDQGVMTAGAGIPTISSISGAMELTGKDFILRGMTGRFGSSPFTLDGKVADFSLDAPASYPFTMTMEPAPAEVAWLMRREDPGQASFSGQSQLRLSGAGTAGDYRLAGLWDLTRADYRYQQLIHKPAGLPNHLSFNARLDAEVSSIPDVHYELPGLSISANATYRYADGAPPSLAFAATSSRFAVKANLSLFPVLAQYQPAGTLQATISGSGNPATAGKIGLQGAVILTNVSALPTAQLPRVSGLDGTIHFTEKALETAHLTGRVGNSPLTIRGRLDSFARPEIDLDFSSPGLHLQDLGFHSPDEELTVGKLAGRLSLRNGNLAINALSGVLHNSIFSLSGEILDLMKPQISLDVVFSVLRVEDLLPLARLTRGGKATGQAGVDALKARVTVRNGSIRDLPFKMLAADFSLKNRQLVVQSMSVGVFGGTVAASGQADFSAGDGTRYQARYQLEHVDSERLLEAAGIRRVMSGTLAGQGELTARGDTPGALKSSARGSGELSIKNGLLNAPADGVKMNGGRVPFEIRSRLSFANNLLTLQSVRIDAFDGTIAGTGSADFTTPQNPGYRLSVRCEQLDAARFFQTAGLSRVNSGRLTLQAELSANGSSLEKLRSTASGSAEVTLAEGMLLLPANAPRSSGIRLPFRKIESQFYLDRNMLALQSARVDAFGGVIIGEGLADFNVHNGPGYQLNIHMLNLDAATFMQALGLPHEISGRLTLQGELTANGDNAAALKKTVDGPVVLRLRKGVIYRFPIVSKVFSLLNVSQLLDFRLPDLVSTGMPYDTIDGLFTFANGSVATSDLSVRSESISMTLVGKADMINENVDVTIGVIPLQTLGRIISRIPVIGWLLTGKDRSVLVFYYTAKGPWRDPTVTSTSTAALSKGVIDIFKRIYNLPDKMLNDPGKVFLGN